MISQNKLQLTINIVNNDEKNLICNCCSRPILPKDFEEIINLNYSDAPEFFKIYLKNQWIDAHKYINLKNTIDLNNFPDTFGDKRSLDILNTQSKLPLDKLPRRIVFTKWKTFLHKFFSFSTNL